MSLHVKVTLASTSNLPKDAVVNTFAVVGGSPSTVDDAAAMASAFAGFYNSTPAGQTLPLASYLSGELQGGVANSLLVSIYDLTGKENGIEDLGSPWHEQAFTLQQSANQQALPGEVAAVITLDGIGADFAAVENSLNQRPKQRRRGRIYVGPLGINAVAAGSNVEPRPAAAFIGTALGAVVALDAAIQAADPDTGTNSGGSRLGVWSRSDATVRRVVGCSMDNAFDTIRSRGLAPTARTVQAL